jgi:hypothetical protein
LVTLQVLGCGVQPVALPVEYVVVAQTSQVPAGCPVTGW